MEDTLRVKKKFGSKIQKPVLILVLMEDTLRGTERHACGTLYGSLNPCFNGRYSQSFAKEEDATKFLVLILVLMEDTLRELLI